jgi:hypothetical protein
MADQVVNKIQFKHGSKSKDIKWVYQNETLSAEQAAQEIETQLRDLCDLASTDKVLVADTDGCSLTLVGVVNSMRNHEPCSEIVEGALVLNMTVKKSKLARAAASNSGGPPEVLLAAHWAPV